MRLATCIYVLSILLANQTAHWFVPLPMFGMVSIGTLFFSLTFTQRDVIHACGRCYVYRVIAVTALLSVLQCALLAVPARIILASFLALVISEAVDTEVFQALKNRIWLVRVLSSNAVSVPIDTLLVNILMFVGILSWQDLTSLVVGELVVKYFVAAGLACGLSWHRINYETTT